MKKIFFIFISVIGIIYEANGQGTLRVTTNSDYIISLGVDNRYYKKHNKSLTVGNLPAGKHWIEVYSYNPHARNRYGAGFRRRDLLYEGKIKTFSGELTTCTVDINTGNVKIKREPDQYSANNRGDDMYGNNTNPTPPDSTRISSPYNENNISTDEMNKLGKKVADKLTDTDKMKKMQNGLKDKTVSTVQVAMMMSWLNFESTRLEFAEWAYSITTDKENYKQLASKFSNDKSKQQLEDFLQKQNK
jgi:hypothetical protein